MHTAETSPINLLLWGCGKRKIRYLYLGDSSFSVTKADTEEKQVIPLFLGADLYSDTDIRSENHTRYHAKFAKKGLAAKLVFSSEHRFHGLRVSCGTNSLWFYSVQGVLRVAFELYSKQEQLSVLESFQDLWKSRLNDDLLKMTYQVTRRLDSPSPPPQNTLTTAHVDTHRRKTTEDTPNHCVRAPGPHGPEHKKDTPRITPDAHVQSTLDAGPLETSHQNNLDEIPGEHPHSPGPFENKHHDSPGDDTPSEDHAYCSPVKTIPPDTTNPTCQLSQALTSLQSKLQSFRNVASDQMHTTILSLLSLAENCIDGERTLDEERWAKAVLSLLQLQTPGSLSVYSSPLLQAVAGWLGRCFHAAHSCISQQVESFKVRHIEHISDLPPAEELAAELFPEAMRTLLVNWMGLSEEAALWKRHSEFPILLLILEFANHNLITGVAHVLYSSLICK
ncbi:uncharacterized protein si:ch211-110p13.9 [Engraulis encrasicolus]|uniref:uncharacterized protein si:ch211-110p13.9 n=1 Tax=Engraulis encrasicolus TaxID=184585 RepID=UPI002FD14AED